MDLQSPQNILQIYVQLLPKSNVLGRGQTGKLKHCYYDLCQNTVCSIFNSNP